MGNYVTVVTSSELRGFCECKTNVCVFGSYEKAVQWIDGRITDIVNHWGLDRLRNVDGWYVMIEGESHTVQFDAEEQEVR